jgi:chromosome segregation ATPase
MSTAVTHETLRAMIADLDGYIERKAIELAAERIGTANDAASDRVAAVVADLNRRLDESQQARQLAEDLAQELRRKIAPLDRQASAAGVARDRLAAALGVHPYGYDLTTIVRDVEKALASLREPALSDTERWQIEEARDVLARWTRDHGEIHDREKVMADQARVLLGLVDQLVPKGGPCG